MLERLLWSLRTVSGAAAVGGLVIAVVAGESPWPEISVASIVISPATWITLGFVIVLGMAHHRLTHGQRPLAWLLLVCVTSVGAATLILDAKLAHLGLGVCTALSMFSVAWVALLHMDRRRSTTDQASEPR